MPASLAELVIQDGAPAIYCPATGVVVFDPENGFDPERPQSRYVRFFIGWMGDTYAARPEDLPPEQAAYQERLITIAADNDEPGFESQNALIAACVEAMPASALILEILNPPDGSFQGEVCYVAFDLARIEDDTLNPSGLRLAAIEDLE